MGKVQTENLDRFNINNRKWQGIPSIDIDKNGILYASWYSGGNGEGHENYVLMHKSIDNGKSVSSPLAAVAPRGYIRAYDPCVFTDPDGLVHWFWAESHGMYDGKCGVWESIISNTGFSNPRRICDGILMNKPTIIKNGDWLFPAAIWSMEPYFKHSEGPVKVNDRVPPGAYCVISSDSGKTHRVAGKAVPDEPSCDEHMIVKRIDGSLWMLVRVKYGIGESFSYDGGTTWSKVKPSPIKSPVSRFFIRRMPSGRLLLLNHYDFNGRNNLHALLSDDDGETWPHKLLLDERESVSYPDAAIRPGGEINIIYDRERYGASQILTARITENEILDGCITDSGSYLKNVISSRNPLV
jgi:hypothetical protein